MADGGNNLVIHESLKKARQYAEERNYGRSFAHYLVVFQLLSQHERKAYETEFANILQLWASILHKQAKYDDVFKCFQLAITYFSTSVEILNNLGVHALKLNCFSSAKKHFIYSLQSDPNYLPAEQNLQNVKHALVERYHFPMLNDLDRNKSYAQAIFRSINDRHAHILDVRTGTGILSLFASKSKQCKSIIACEHSETMFDIAQLVFSSNNATIVKLIKKRASQLNIPHDLPTKATLLLTDITDCGIFGGNILCTMIHAWDHLLMPFPYAKVIPASVSIYVTGINSAYISRKVRLMPRENNVLNINQIKLIQSTIPCDSENVRNSKVNYVTNTTLAICVNFENIHQLKSLKNLNAMPSATLKCIENATIEMFVIWFTLHLNETISITNAPKSSSNVNWNQAITHLRQPINVKENDELNIKLKGFEQFIEIKCEQQSDQQSKCYLVPKSAILFLNDFLLMDKIEVISKMMLKQYHQKLTVLDLSPFPILGLLLLKAGAHLTCRVDDPSILNAILQVCKLNDVNPERITFVKPAEFNYNTREYDVIFQHLINAFGLLDGLEICQVEAMKLSLTAKGIYLPYKIDVWAQLVESAWFNRTTKVDDRNVCGFKIAAFINEYKSTQRSDINFDEIPYTSLCDPINVGSVNLNSLSSDVTTTQVPIIQHGLANAVFYWFEIELIPGIKISTRRPDSFAANAAFLFNYARPVVSGYDVPLSLKQHKGILKIYINRSNSNK